MDVQRELADEDATRQFAGRLAPLLQGGDLILLEGDLGAGKSTFARALIQARAGAPIEVPSPTFTLVQPYALHGLFILHADLYRLGGPDEAIELGLEEALDHAALLIEWPDRHPDLYHQDHLLVSLTGDDAATPDRRRIRLSGGPAWTTRLKVLAE